MKLKLQKQIKLKNQFRKAEVIKNVNKFLFVNFLNNITIKESKRKRLTYFFEHTLKTFQRSSKVKIVRRCELSNRGRGNIRKLGISRILARNLIESGVIPGYTKHIW